jgi:hypothetical protein
MHHTQHWNDSVVWWSILAFFAALFRPTMFSGYSDDWNYALFTSLAVLPLILILILNRVFRKRSDEIPMLDEPSRIDRVGTHEFHHIRLTPTRLRKASRRSTW